MKKPPPIARGRLPTKRIFGVSNAYVQISLVSFSERLVLLPEVGKYKKEKTRFK
ncbi:hypothetical protein GGR27_001445 [Lewinella antarctica]|uniref:Uncharacterized protein n=1 Tax=Neolewinella antarctica TaxID=442734 RepID=A0ABX0X9N9_9BACT|nr:hypothetical protein [Neolewinella antarctica]